MSEHSPAQKQYLLRVKREKNLIRVSRILLFLGFLASKVFRDRKNRIPTMDERADAAAAEAANSVQ